MHWHYSKRMPRSKEAHIGVWEDGAFIGALIFGGGANHHLASSYGLDPVQACELLRVALTNHVSPVSQIAAIALRMVRRSFTGLRLVISFADPDEGHMGTIYQAGNWLYFGTTNPADEFLVHGKKWHGRALRSTLVTAGMTQGTTLERARTADPDAQIVKGSAKHRYLYPLDDAMRAQLTRLAKPYPKRATSIDSDAPGFQSGEGGAEPTVALHSLPDDMTGGLTPLHIGTQT